MKIALYVSKQTCISLRQELQQTHERGRAVDRFGDQHESSTARFTESQDQKTEMQLYAMFISQEPRDKDCTCLVREGEPHLFNHGAVGPVEMPSHPKLMSATQSIWFRENTRRGSRLNGPYSALDAVWSWWSTVTLDHYHVEYLVPSMAVASDELDTSWMPTAEAGLFGSDFAGMIFQE